MSIEAVEYLVSYGQAGDFGRFRAEPAIACQRGQRVVVRTSRGLEIGHVLREATERHALHLPNHTVGPLLRSATMADERVMETLHSKGPTILQRANQLSDQLQLPIFWVDVEMLLDDQHVVLHHLGSGGADIRPLISTLSREFDLHLIVLDLSGQTTAEEEDHDHADHEGCGREGCGKGNCSSGGCSTCSAPSKKTSTSPSVDFAALRHEMETRRTPLL